MYLVASLKKVYASSSALKVLEVFCQRWTDGSRIIAGDLRIKTESARIF
jgi:hypothetical protein